MFPVKTNDLCGFRHAIVYVLSSHIYLHSSVMLYPIVALCLLCQLKMKANTKADAKKNVMDETRPWQNKRRSREE